MYNAIFDLYILISMNYSYMYCGHINLNLSGDYKYDIFELYGNLIVYFQSRLGLNYLPS